MKPRAGLVTVSLDGERTDLAKKIAISARDNLIKNGINVVGNNELILKGSDVIKSVEYAKKQKADCIIYLVATWVYAPDIITAVQMINMPTIIWGVPEPASFSSVGANVIHGSLDELGLKHKLAYGDTNDVETINEILAFSRAAMAVQSLKMSRLGLIGGGHTIGSYPTSSDPNQIKRIFGVEVEHVDQLVLLERAKAIKENEAHHIYEEIKQEYGLINVPDEAMIKSIKVYVALKQMVQDYKFNFVAVKCLEEFISTFTSCCLAVALINDDGIVTACQGNLNAALSMMIMNILTGQPVIFSDVNVIEKKTGIARLVNCGSMPPSLAKKKKEVDWGYQYEYMGQGRGACTVFCCKAGKVTFGTLGRIKGDYVMQIATGEAFEKPKEALAEVRDIWPQAFIKLNCKPLDFYYNLRSNHSVVGYGDVTQELIYLCDLLDIQPIVNG